MSSPLVSRTPVCISDSLRRQLNTYALVATAAGVGVLALSQPAEARIVYTRTHHVIPPKSTFYIHFGSGGGASARNILQSSIVSNTQVVHALIDAGGLGTYAGVAGNSQGSALALSAQRRVGPHQFFESRATMVESTCVAGKVKSHGRWANQKDHYLGLTFWLNRGIHYGWMRVNVSNRDCKMTATVTGYAYETIAKKPIITGKTKGPDVVTLPPGSLGQLARGRR